MNIWKDIGKLWNRNFNRGVTVYQCCLMASIILGVMMDNQFLVLFCMFNCLAGYLQDTDDRFSLRGARR